MSSKRSIAGQFLAPLSQGKGKWGHNPEISLNEALTVSQSPTTPFQPSSRPPGFSDRTKREKGGNSSVDSI